MRIGILTFNCALNYGASLQMYALYKTIKSIKPDALVEVIDYRPSYFQKALSCSSIPKCNPLVRILKMINLEKRKAVFKRFRKKYVAFSSESFSEKTLSSIKDKYDIVICGSDQIWNTTLTHGDLNYYLPFIDSEKKATYAVSMGSELFNFDKNAIEDSIVKYNVISVRESYSMEQLSSYIEYGIRVRHDIDPVLLAQKEIWSGFSNSKEKEQYILVFEVSRSRELLEQAFSFAKTNKLKVHYIGPYIKMNGIKYIPSPCFKALFDEFSHAKYVFSNSYHGTLLSIIHMKKFYSKCDLDNNGGGRIGDILKRLNLIERTIADRIENDIDWIECNELIREYSLDSLNYLRGVINCN